MVVFGFQTFVEKGCVCWTFNKSETW